jgi:hypothetical protein
MATKIETVYLLSCQNCDFTDKDYSSIVSAARRAEEHIQEFIYDEMENITHTIIIAQETSVSYDWD